MSIVSLKTSSDNSIDESESNRVALKAFFKLSELWAITQLEQSLLLGKIDRSTLIRWKNKIAKNEPIALKPHQVERLSLLLGIHKALRMIYSEKPVAYGWVKRENQIFGNDTPIKFMTNDVSIMALYSVREYLDQMRGGPI